MSSPIRTVVLALAVVVVLAGGWLALRPGEDPVGPGGVPDSDAGNGGGDPGGGHEPTSPPPPGAEVVELLGRRESDPEGVRKNLAEMARTKDGVHEIIGAIARSDSGADRAVLLLHLVRGGTAEGIEHVRAAAAGKGREEDRVPALYALAGGDASDVERIAAFLAGPEDGELFRAAVSALALRGDDAALIRLEAMLAQTGSESRRQALYASLGGGPMAPGPDFLALIRETMPGLEGEDESRPGYRRFVDRVSRESVPSALAPAAELLLRLPGADAQRGVTDLWERSGSDTRPILTETILANLRMDRPGAVRTVATVAAGLNEETPPHHRENVRTRIREIRSTDALAELREWREREDDPELCNTLDEEIRRLESETQPR